MARISKYTYCLIISSFTVIGIYGQNNVPAITNASITADVANHTLKIRYDVQDKEHDSIDIAIRISGDGGQTFLVTPSDTKGDLGFPVFEGTGKEILVRLDNVPFDITACHVKLIAADRQPVDLKELVAQVDTVSLKKILGAFYGIRNHKSKQGREGLSRAREMLRTAFQDKGLYTYEQDSVVDKLQIRNIISRKPGLTADKDIIIVCAHYDTVEKSPGADDNGSGIAGMLEAMRILSQYSFNNTLEFIGFDLEEAGVYGSSLFVFDGGIRKQEKVKGAFNFDMIGYSTEVENSQIIPDGFSTLFPAAYKQVAADGFRGNFVLNVSNEHCKTLGQAFDSMARQYVPALKVVSIVTPGKGESTPGLLESDHAPFWDRSWPAIHIGDGASTRNRAYHSKNDVLSTIDYRFLREIVQATIVTIAGLAGIEHASETILTISQNQ